MRARLLGMVVRGVKSKVPRAAVLTATLLAACASEGPPAPPREPIAFKRYFDDERTSSAIFVINPDGSGERQVTRPPAGFSDDQPDWSPDRSRIAVDRCGPETCGAWIVSVDGSSSHQIAPLNACPPGVVPPACDDDGWPAFSPDGRRVAYVRSSGRIVNEEIESSQLVVSDVDGRKAKVLTRFKEFAGDINGPSWSPDGKRIVFGYTNAGTTPSGAHSLFVINADGTGLRRITPYALKASDSPAWSPKADLIAFHTETDSDTGSGDIYTIRSDGSALKRLTDVGKDVRVTSCSFSPDGEWIVFGKTGTAGAPGLFIMRENGTDTRRVTRTALWD